MYLPNHQGVTVNLSFRALLAEQMTPGGRFAALPKHITKPALAVLWKETSVMVNRAMFPRFRYNNLLFAIGLVLAPSLGVAALFVEGVTSMEPATFLVLFGLTGLTLALFAHWDKVRELAEARANLRASQRNEARLNDMLLRAYGGRRQVPEPPLLLAETQPRVVINSVRVRELLTGQMTEEEVQTLAYDLELEDIPGGPKSGQVRALLVAVETRKRWGALLDWLDRHRPDLSEELLR
jgi:hypothetical protein